MSAAIQLPPHLAELNRPTTRMKRRADELALIYARMVRDGRMRRSDALNDITGAMVEVRDEEPPFGPLTPDAEAERTMDAGRIHATAGMHLDAAIAALDKPKAGAANGRHEPGGKRRAAPAIMSAASLMEKQMPILRWALRGILPQGYTIFAGPPKLGKSWLCYQLAVAVARGDDLFGQDTQQADVLLLALEDGERRAQDRLRKVLDGREVPPRLHLAFDWPKLTDGGLEAIEQWASTRPGALVILDTLAKVKPPGTRGANAYDADNAIHGPLHALARAKGITLVAVTHLKKGGGGEDWAEGITGSMGISGTADTLMVLQRKRGAADGFLNITGRDVAEMEFALRHDKERGQWSSMGDAQHYKATETKRAIFLALRAAGLNGMSPNEVAERCGVSRNTVKVALHRMADKGEVQNLAGRYVLPA